ncbi:MAG: hydrolase [Deltaproteobacteria bacterium]|jgi:predicted hydrolase (HD superfamily)|nr:hydrolase [Deltaproteobacteria bacterium]
MGKFINREEAWELLCEYTKSAALRTHALAVEAAMLHFAALEGLTGAEAEKWGVVGLLHDFDYEKFPDEHCVKSAELLREHGLDEEYIHAVCSHGFGICTDVEPANKMEKVLYTIDELTGLINAACLLRPSRSVLDLELKSVKKKFKDLNFAAGVNREIIQKGCAMLGADLDEIITQTIAGMRARAEALGLKGNL